MRKGRGRQGKSEGKSKGKKRQSKGRAKGRKGKGKAKAREEGREEGREEKSKAGKETRKGKGKRRTKEEKAEAREEGRRCDELTLCCAATTSSLTACMTATLYMAWTSLPPTSNRSLCSSKSADHAGPHVSVQQP